MYVIVRQKQSVIKKFFISDLINAENFTCYQCKRKTNVECGEEDLLPCSPIYDRCVTHITKDSKIICLIIYYNDVNVISFTGSGDFTIKRECGLAPCGFNDAMVDKGLGLDNCDRSKHEYSCILCCKGNGCNKSGANSLRDPFRIVSLTLVLIVIINLAKNYFPPYVIQSEDILQK